MMIQFVRDGMGWMPGSALAFSKQTLVSQSVGKAAVPNGIAFHAQSDDDDRTVGRWGSIGMVRNNGFSGILNISYWIPFCGRWVVDSR